MVASDKTVGEIISVVLTHADLDTLARIIADLKKVKGNLYYSATILKMEAALPKK